MKPFTISASGRLFQISADSKRLEQVGGGVYLAPNFNNITPYFEELESNGFWAALQAAGQRAGRTSYQLEFTVRVNGNYFNPGINVKWFRGNVFNNETGGLLNYILEYDTTGQILI